MYSESVRRAALALLEQGLTPAEVSRRMGGMPGHVIIRSWAHGQEPKGKRRRSRLYSLEEKLEVIKRLDAARAIAQSHGSWVMRRPPSSFGGASIERGEKPCACASTTSCNAVTGCFCLARAVLALPTRTTLCDWTRSAGVTARLLSGPLGLPLGVRSLSAAAALSGSIAGLCAI